MPSVEPSRLHSFVREVMACLGSNDREQTLVADQLVGANLAGHDSHGVGMLPTYVDRAVRGLVAINGATSVRSDGGAVVVLDGNRAFGQVAGFEAMAVAIERARLHGVALVGLSDSFHIGRIGHWGEQVARAGLISLHFVNVAGHDPLVAPFGGRQARFGTNPFCAAIPGGDGEPMFLLDFATSRIALGKARVANNSGTLVPDGSIIGLDGQLTNDPSTMFGAERAALVAMGDHKGSGLAMLCELLGAALLGGTATTASMNADGSVLNSMTTIAIDPASCGDPTGMRAIANEFLDWVRASQPAHGSAGVVIPGEPEHDARVTRATSIAIDDTTFAELHGSAAMVGAAPLS